MSHHAEPLLQTIDNLIYAASFEQLISVCKIELVDARKHMDREREAVVLVGLAEAHKYLGKFYEARVYIDGTIQLLRESGADDLLARALMARGSLVHLASNKLDEAESDYREALNIAHRTQNPDYTIAALHGIAEILQQANDLHRARNYAREAFELARDADHWFYMASSLAILGALSAQENQAEKALKTYQDALSLCQKHHFTLLEGSLISSIGAIMVETGRYTDEGFRMMQRGIEMAQSIACIPQEFAAIYRLGNAHQALGNYQQAQERFEEMLAQAQYWRNRPYEATSFYELGRLHLLNQAYDEAIINLEQALLINRETMNPFHEAQTETLIGYTCSLQHDYDAALDHYMAARVLYDALDDQSHAQTMTQAIIMTYISRFFDRILRFLGLRKKDKD